MNNNTKDMTTNAAIRIDASELKGGVAESQGATGQPDAILIDEEQLYRSSAYSLLAGMLRTSPDQSLLDHLGRLATPTSDGDDLMLSMSTLALSAQRHQPDTIEEEFYQLFIGLGKGEVVPYGSWYLTGFLMEKPLSDLRDDLRRLGFARSEDVVEPEDHVAALFEVMSIMIHDAVALDAQKQFFETHVQSWIDRFFSDLAAAQSSVFYKSVARFGAAFIALEKQYFSMQS